jgi:dephospho-CoA kinase
MLEPAFTVALTGGIASGKSAVAERFAALGVAVIDADVIARELVAPGTPALAEIVEAFGTDVLDASGALDRRLMRKRVFEDERARAKIDLIVHPRVRQVMRERAAAIDAPYVLLVIPLLVESGHYDWVDRVLVVDVPRTLQRTRLLARDGITEQLADAMLDAQASRAQRLVVSDDIIPNDGSMADLHAHVLDLHTRYLALAKRKTSASPGQA